METALWIVQALLAAIFLAAGLTKLTQPRVKMAAGPMGWAESPGVLLSRAEEMANKALSIDEFDVRARIVLGRIHLFYHRYDQAKAEIDRAIAINPNDANGLAGRGNILMWSGQTDAAIEALELAQRIDPELNLRKTTSANFSRILLAATYAQLGRSEDAARVVTTIHRLDPTFDAQEFGTKFLSAADLERLRDGLRKAGFSTDEAGRR